jgi:hypothetical protein
MLSYRSPLLIVFAGQLKAAWLDRCVYSRVHRGIRCRDVDGCGVAE